MTRTLPLVLTAAFLACNPTTDEPNDPSPLDLAANALGGADVLTGIQTIRTVATGNSYIDYATATPEDLEHTSTYAATYHLDWDGDRQRHDITRSQHFGTLQFLGEQEFAFVIDGQVGELTADAGFAPAGPIPSDQVGATTMKQRLLYPHTFLRDGLAAPDSVTVGAETTYRGSAHVPLTVEAAVSPVTLYVDADTGLVSGLTTRMNHPLVRDVEVEVRFDSWTSVGDSAFPERVELLSGGLTIQTETRTAFVVDGDMDPSLFEMNDAGTLDEARYDWGQRTAVAADAFFGLISYLAESSPFQFAELAPGVGMYAGASNSLVLEHDGGLVVVEAAGSPARADAMIAAIEAQYPGRAITHLVQSHFHYDHASGARSFAAAGVELVVGHGVGALWSSILTAPSTVHPDTLAGGGGDVGSVNEIAEGGMFEIDDGLDLTVHHLTSVDHAVDMVLPVFEVGGTTFVYVTDIYNAGFGLTILLGGQQVFFNDLRRLGLIDASCASDGPLMIVPSHGVPQSLEASLAELAGLGVDVGCP